MRCALADGVKVRLPWLILALFLATAPATAAERLVGRAKAIDGDTLEVGGVRVRLQGVAAPEVALPGQPKAEPGAPEAAAFMARLVDGYTLSASTRASGRG